MKRIQIITLLFLAGVKLPAQDVQKPSRWEVNTQVVMGDAYYFYNAGATYLHRDRHSISLGIGVVPNEYRKKNYVFPGATLNYSYYLKDFFAKPIRFFLSATLDYHKLKYKRSDYDFPPNVRSIEVIDNLNLLAGAGVSARFLKRFTASAGLHLILVHHDVYSYFRDVGNGYGRSEWYYNLSVLEHPMFYPFVFRARIGYLIR